MFIFCSLKKCIHYYFIYSQISNQTVPTVTLEDEPEEETEMMQAENNEETQNDTNKDRDNNDEDSEEEDFDEEEEDDDEFSSEDNVEDNEMELLKQVRTIFDNLMLTFKIVV